MQQVREGDVAKLAVLFERHHRPLFSYFVRLTGDRDASEDLVQDVFFRILKYRHTWRDGYTFTSWMYQIARNARVDIARGRKAEIIPIDEGRESPEPGPRERAEQAEHLDLLRRALAVLDEEKREVLVLSRFQDLNYEQIGEILGLEANTVKVRVFRAVKALGRIFHQLSGEKAS